MSRDVHLHLDTLREALERAATKLLLFGDSAPGRNDARLAINEAERILDEVHTLCNSLKRRNDALRRD